MRVLLLLSATLLCGCIVVHPHHHHGSYDDLDESQSGLEGDGETRRGLRSGSWLFSLSDPDEHGDCSAVELGGTAEATLEVALTREGSALTFVSEYGTIQGTQTGPEIEAFGTVKWEGEPIEVELEADAEEQVYLDGLLLGWSGPCLIAVQLEGSFIGEVP
jgi:hypothetical protein